MAGLHDTLYRHRLGMFCTVINLQAIIIVGVQFNGLGFFLWKYGRGVENYQHTRVQCITIKIYN